MAVSKKVQAEQMKKEDEIKAMLASKLHQTMTELEEKRATSTEMFKNTKITSCSRILQKNG